MRSLTEPGLWLRPFLFVLRFYLCLFMLGCAAHRPPLAEVRSMETRLMPGDEGTVFKACVGTLQDLGYAVDTSDYEGGVLTASRETHDPSGAISADSDATGEKKGMPTWGKVLLIATGVILIVGAVALFTGHDDDSAKETGAARDSTRYKDAHHDERKVRARHEGRHEREHHEPPPTYIVETTPPDPPPLYRYRITIDLHGKGDATRVRVSLRGTQYAGDESIREGPVDDPALFERFFAALDRSIDFEQREAGR